LYPSISVSHGIISHLGNVTSTCPTGYQGEVILACNYASVSVLSGGCYAHCSPEEHTVNGHVVQVGAMNHSQTLAIACSSGYDGDLVFACSNGVVSMDGWCFQACPAQDHAVSLTSWDTNVSVGAMSHNQQLTVNCPSSHSGSVTFVCHDGILSLIDGACSANCLIAEKAVATGIGDITVSVDAANHSHQVAVDCPAQYSGSLIFACSDGVFTHTGTCEPLCLASNVTVGQATISMGPMNPGEVLQHQSCPTSPSQLFSVTCDQGAFVLSGACLSDCAPASQVGGMDVSVTAMAHLHEQVVPCPVGFTGNVEIKCHDGDLSITASTCLESGPVEEKSMEKVSLSMTVANVNYNSLITDASLMHSFTSFCKAVIAEKAGSGIVDEDVDVTLSEGSVNVHAVITIPPASFATAGSVQSNVVGAKESGGLSSALVTTISSISGISDHTSGPISIQSVSVTSSTASTTTTHAVEETAPAPGESGGLNTVLIAVIAAVVGTTCCVCLCCCAGLGMNYYMHERGHAKDARLQPEASSSGKPGEDQVEFDNNEQNCTSANV
jgi:hypothetical protein